MNNIKQKNGFTLVELLIVIAIIAILFSVVFVALNPLLRFKDSRDSTRWQDVSAVIEAVKVNQIDNKGKYITAINDMIAGEVYMIVGGTMVTGCDDGNTYCDTPVSRDYNCVNLSDLVDGGYLGDIPVSDAGEIVWDRGELNGQNGTGYTIQRDSTGIITVRACESENSSEIFLVK